MSEINVTIAPEDQKFAMISNYNLLLDFTSSEDFEKNYITLILSDGVDIAKSSSVKIKINLTDNYPPEQLKIIPEIILYKDEILTNILDLDYYFKDLDHKHSGNCLS